MERYNQTKGRDGEGGGWEMQGDLQTYIWQTLIWGIILYIKHLWFLMMSWVSKGKMIPGEPGREWELHKILLIGFIRCIIRYLVQGGSEKKSCTFWKHKKSCWCSETCPEPPVLFWSPLSHTWSVWPSHHCHSLAYQKGSKATRALKLHPFAAKVEGCGLQSCSATR